MLCGQGRGRGDNNSTNSELFLHTLFTSFFCAISDRTLELHAAESKNKEMEQRLVNLKKKLTATLVLEKQLEK